jgi:hypothetical protein
MSTFRFHNIGPILSELGYQPIPVKPGEKAPAIDQWSTIPIDLGVVQGWAANGHANCSVGIRCGGGIGAIDVDVLNKEMSRKLYYWIEDNFCTSVPLIRIGQKPKFLIPCRFKDIDHKMISTAYRDVYGSINKIEILTTGQQYVAYGRHPNGFEYTWQGENLFTTKADDLIFLDEYEILSLFDEFDRLAEEAGWKEYKKATQVKKAVSEGDDFAFVKFPSVSIKELKEALDRLPAYVCDERDDWIKVGMVIHFETQGSEEGYELFDNWSRKSKKYVDQKDTRRRWKSFLSQKPGTELVSFGTIQNYLDEEELFPAADAAIDFFEVANVANVANYEEDELFPADTAGGDEVANVATSCYMGKNVASFAMSCDMQQDFVATELLTDTRNEGISAAIWQIISDSSADFTTVWLHNELDARTHKKKAIIRAILSRFEKKGMISKKPGVRGAYQIVEQEIENMGPNFTEEEGIPLPMPFDLHKLIKILPGSVVVVGGATNAGKTLLGFSFLRCFLTVIMPEIAIPSSQSNKSSPSLRSFTVRGCPLKFAGIRFLNSEMSSEELGYVLKCMGQDGQADPDAMVLNNMVQWVRRTRDWQRAILKDGINVVDFLQIHKDFYEIGGVIAEMADALGHGILIVLIQKKSGESAPRGGDFALERARIAINLDYAGPGVSSLYLRKVKHPVDYRDNPQGKELDFSFDEQLNPVIVEPLRRLTKKERESINHKRMEDDRRTKSALVDFIKIREGKRWQS